MANSNICPACGIKDDFSRLTSIISVRIIDADWPISICRTCGYTGIVPSPGQRRIRDANARWFGQITLGDAGGGIGDTKAQTVRHLIRPYLADRPVNCIADIGARRGEYLHEISADSPDARRVAIELVDDYQKELIKIGAEVIIGDIEGCSSMHFDADLIIFRHILEHLDDPATALKSLANKLSPTGIIYIDVPNALAIKPGRWNGATPKS